MVPILKMAGAAFDRSSVGTVDGLPRGVNGAVAWQAVLAYGGTDEA